MRKHASRHSQRESLSGQRCLASGYSGARWMRLAALSSGRTQAPLSFRSSLICDYRRPFSMILTSGPREILAMKPALRTVGTGASSHERRQDQRRSFVPSQRRGCDAEEAQLRSKNRLFLELVVANPIVAGDHDPPLRSRLREPHHVLGGLRKELVVHTYVERQRREGPPVPSYAQRAIDEEYEGLRRLSPAGARSGPLPRC